MYQSLIPPSETKVLEGKTSITGELAIETQIIADVALEDAATVMGTKLATSNPNIGTFVFVSSKDLAALAALNPFRSQLANLKAQLDSAVAAESEGGPEALGVAALMAPGVATGVLKSVADLVALFRTDTTITAQAFALDEAQVIGHLADALLARAPAPGIYYTGMMPPGLLDGNSDLIVRVQDVERSLQQARRVLARLTSRAQQDKDGKAKQERTDQIVVVREAVTATEQALTRLYTVDAQSGISPLMALVQAEHLEARATPANAATVTVRLLKAGGQTRVDRNLWRGSRVQHSGGFLLSCFAFDKNGKAFFADTVRGYEGPVQFKTIQKDGRLTNK